MKQNKQLVFLVGLVAVAFLVWYFGYFRSGKSSGGTSNTAAIGSVQLLGIDNPELHWPELKAAHSTEYKSNGRNPFSPEAPIQQQQPTVVAQAPSKHYGPDVIAPPPPPTLPGNLKFFGYGTVPNGTARRAFFSDGDDVLIVSEGETLLGRYRIVKVNNTNLEFEEIASGRHNTTPLVEDQAALAQPST
jgi:hypothetical protein